MTKILKDFLKEESGATAIEYGLIVAVIALAIMAAVGAVGNSMNDQFNTIEATVSGS